MSRLPTIPEEQPQMSIPSSIINIFPSSVSNSHIVSRKPVLSYEAQRDKIYTQLTEKQVREQGFLLDGDVYCFDISMPNTTRVCLSKNRHRYITSPMFKQNQTVVTEDSLRRINEFLTYWGKIPSFLDIRESPGKGFGVFAKERIQAHTFLGYYDGLRIPDGIDRDNPYYFNMSGWDNQPFGTIDAKNLTFSNFACLINDGPRPNIVYRGHSFQVLIETTEVIEAGQELLGSYGEWYWKTHKGVRQIE